MRYLVLGLAVLVATGILCGICGTFLDRQLAEIENLISLSEDAYASGDYDAALEYARTASDIWENRHSFIDATVVRSASADVGRFLAVLADELGDDADYARMLFADALEAVRHMRQTERLTIGNIL